MKVFASIIIICGFISMIVAGAKIILENDYNPTNLFIIGLLAIMTGGLLKS